MLDLGNKREFGRGTERFLALALAGLMFLGTVLVTAAAGFFSLFLKALVVGAAIRVGLRLGLF